MVNGRIAMGHELVHRGVSEAIIGAAMTVLGHAAPGCRLARKPAVDNSRIAKREQSNNREVESN